MDKSNGWLNSVVTDWIDGLAKLETPRCSGLFVVKWEAEERGPNLAPSEAGEAHVRVSRLMRASALRFAQTTGATLGWTQAGTTLIMAVAAPAEEDGEAGVAIGKLSYALRELLYQRFVSSGVGRRYRGSVIRCGFGAMANPADGHDATRGDVFARIVRAAETALGRMFSKDNEPLRFGDENAERDATKGNASLIDARYAPIVSLLDGSLYGYEAIPFDKQSGKRIDLNRFYSEANEAGNLFESDRAFREAAIRGVPSRTGDVKLFLPVPAEVVFDNRLYPGSTLRRIESAGLRPEHVVLVLVGGEAERGAAMKAALSHYRTQGFRIALSGITSSRESLLRMVALQPDYAFVNVGWIGDESPGSVEESLLQAMTAVARKAQIVLIAEGMNREEGLRTLVASGMSYGQGDWIGGERLPNGQTALSSHVQKRIRAEVQRRYRGASGSLSELAVQVGRFSRETQVSEIARHFEQHRETQAFVITEGGRPVGLLMKEKLHQLLSGQFGLPLYWNRAVGKIMDAHPMIVDESVPIDQVSQMAMSREPDKLYDAVIVTRDGAIAGIVFVRAMLEWVTRTRMELAQSANPLTGLPGNEIIRRELIRRLAEGRPFAIWYADLDHFKWYNDQYGFHRGDEVIRYTADVLTGAVREYDQHNAGDSFVGHVGGDDFIVLTAYEDPVAAARQVLSRFENGVSAFVAKGGKPVSDRMGQPVDAAGLSLSLSLLLFEASEGWTPEAVSERSAHLKKQSKQMKGNSLVWELADSAFAEWSVTSC